MYTLSSLTPRRVDEGLTDMCATSPQCRTSVPCCEVLSYRTPIAILRPSSFPCTASIIFCGAVILPKAEGTRKVCARGPWEAKPEIPSYDNPHLLALHLCRRMKAARSVRNQGRMAESIYGAQPRDKALLTPFSPQSFDKPTSHIGKDAEVRLSFGASLECAFAT